MSKKMSKLVKSVVVKLEMNTAKDEIVFTLDGNSKLHYVCDGDCCSNSWVEHITGLEFLLGATISDIEETDGVEDEKDDRDELVQVYNYKFTTDKGTFVIEMRNGSNGYYGGYMAESYGNIPNAERLKTLTEDF